MKKALQTIGFMILITVVFISILAYVNESSREQILQNLKLDEYKSILYAFQILPKGLNAPQIGLTTPTSELPWNNDEVLNVIDEQIIKKKIAITPEQRNLLKNSYLWWTDSIEVYIRQNSDGETVAYGFPLKGKGLWGTITAFGVISADLKKMIGIDFTDQVETPGLGARIMEQEFKSYFANLDLSKFEDNSGKQSPIVMVRQKTTSNIENSTNELQAITGATQTCNGVLAMLNTDIPFYLKVLASFRK